MRPASLDRIAGCCGGLSEADSDLRTDLAGCLACWVGRGKRAVGPLGGFDLEGIKLVAKHALQLGPAGEAGLENHSLSAVQTSRYPVHRSSPPGFSANSRGEHWFHEDGPRGADLIQDRVEQLLRQIRLHEKTGVVGHIGWAVARDDDDVEARKFAFGELRQFDAGHIAREIDVRHQRS